MKQIAGRRIMGVAFEPWETKLQLSLLSELKSRAAGTHLIVGDAWQVEVADARRKLQAELADRHVGVSFIFRKIVSMRLQTFMGGLVLQKQSVKNDLQGRFDDSVIRRLLLSDHIFQHEERRPYYFPMREVHKLLVLRHVVREIDAALSDFQPTDLIFLGGNYLVKNVCAEIAQETGIACWVVRHSRVQNSIWVTPFWPFDDGRLLGDFNAIVASPADAVIENDDEVIRNPLYLANSEIDRRSLEVLPKSRFRTKLGVIVRALRSQGRSLVAHRRLLAASFSILLTGVYAWSRTLVTVWEVLFGLRRLKFARGSHRYLSEFPPSPYLLIPLHARPESSTLTLGAGLRDEDLVARVATAVKEQNLGISVFALENPSSIGDNRGPIIDLCEAYGVPVLSPLLDTQKLLRRATAVFTISGTASLEADAMGIPAFAAGRPEYGPLLASWGMSLEDFLRQVAAGERFQFGRSAAFVSFMSAHGVQADLGWGSVKSIKQRNAAVEAIVRALSQAGFSE